MAAVERKRESPAPAHGGRFPDPLPFRLLSEPLEYLLADHFRQRAVCALLRDFAVRRHASRAEADRVVAFLSHDLPLHHADEDEDLFPALRRRALPEDELGAVLARLGEDHRRGEPMVGEIVALLSRTPADDPIRFSNEDRGVLQAYAAAEHRHLAIENAVVMTIARVRLRGADLSRISRKMKLRRGVDA